MAFESCKALSCSAPVPSLSAPEFSRPFALEVDASCIGAGAVLIQSDDHGLDHPVGFYSKEVQQVPDALFHSRTGDPGSTVSFAVLRCICGIQSCAGCVYTDHNHLVFIHRMYNHNRRLMRWSLFLQNYRLVIRHKKGKDNVVADAPPGVDRFSL